MFGIQPSLAHLLRRIKSHAPVYIKTTGYFTERVITPPDKSINGVYCFFCFNCTSCTYTVSSTVGDVTEPMSKSSHLCALMPTRYKRAGEPLLKAYLIGIHTPGPDRYSTHNSTSPSRPQASLSNQNKV